MKKFLFVTLAACAIGGAATIGAYAQGTDTQKTAPAGGTTASQQANFNPSDVYSMDLDQLSKIEVKGTASLTKTDARRAPVSTTELDAADIQESGAQDLDHLLEDYVPDTEFIDHQHLQPHVGFRGIISDREDKYVYQINGRTMNDQMLWGADNERAFPLMGDMQQLEVVRGPASATHGAGALAGVIGVQTYTGLTFQGADINFRRGFLNYFTGGEGRFGKKFSDDSGVFLYYGAADVSGADTDFYMGHSYPAANGLPANVAGQPLNYPGLPRYGAAAFGQPWQKGFADYVNGPWELWARFVQDGSIDMPLHEIYTTKMPASLTTQQWVRGRQMLEKQFTFTGSYKKDLSKQWNLNAMESFDGWHVEDQRMATTTAFPNARVATEGEFFTRAIATWSPVAAHSLAFGTEYAQDYFYDPPDSDALDRAPVVPLFNRHWHTNTTSFLAEYQWKINPKWTFFADGRTDKQTYTVWLVSPRGSLVYTPTDRDTIKLIVAKSMRHGSGEELYSQWFRSHSIPSPESLVSYEVSYQHKCREHWLPGANGYFENYNADGWVPALYMSAPLGRYKIAGAELELAYVTANTRVTFSESWTKLINSSLPPAAPPYPTTGLPPAVEGISAQPYGFGNNLAEWSPFLTKLTLEQGLDKKKKWAASSSLVFYQGFPGAKDYANYVNADVAPHYTLATLPSAIPYSDPGYTTPYGPNLYFNVGMEFRPHKDWSIRADGYNLADLFDGTLSKRNYYFRLSEFVVEPASVTVSAHYRF
jgi:iron complex outermembrane receptor protein